MSSEFIMNSLLHTHEQNPLPWSIHPGNDMVVIDANGAAVANFEVKHQYNGVLGNCEKNADLTVRSVNAFARRGGADIRRLQQVVTTWADEVFPNRRTPDILLKLYEEVGEYARDPKAAAEFADIMILLLDLAAINGIDIHKAVTEKMAINVGRTWTVDSQTRIMRHTRDEKP